MTFEVHVLASGSDGNCYVVVNEGRAVMVDCGITCKKAKALMGISGIDHKTIEGILVTHEHGDHISGVRATRNYIKCPVFCTGGTYRESKDLCKPEDFNEVLKMRTFRLGGMDITPLPTSHDVEDPCCYHFEADGKRLLIVTDTGVLTAPAVQALRGCDVAVIESNYDPDMLRNNPVYPDYLKARIAGDFGHMSNGYCGLMIRETQSERKRRFFLAHLSKKNNTPDLARETVSQASGIKRSQLDCLETPLVENDTRIVKVRS